VCARTSPEGRAAKESVPSSSNPCRIGAEPPGHLVAGGWAHAEIRAPLPPVPSGGACTPPHARRNVIEHLALCRQTLRQPRHQRSGRLGGFSSPTMSFCASTARSREPTTNFTVAVGDARR